MNQKLAWIGVIVGVMGWFGLQGMAQQAPKPGSAVVKKLAEGFEFGQWRIPEFQTAGGRVTTVPEHAPDAKGSRRALLIEPSFGGTFGGFGAAPPRPLVIPGNVKSITVRAKVSDNRYAPLMSFKDGWGREQVDGKKLEWAIPLDPGGQWKTSTFTVPADWVQPISIERISTHNWNARNEVKKVQILIDDIEVETDLSQVDLKTGSLKTWKPEPNPADASKALKTQPAVEMVSVDFSTAVPGNFFVDAQPTASIRIQSWRPTELTGQLIYSITDAHGQGVVNQERKPIRVESISGLELSLAAPKFGNYTIDAELSLSDGTRFTKKMAYAKAPKPRELTDEQKEISPYGINYHGGGVLLLEPFRNAGIVWFREYAFTYEWLMRAKGDDGKYAAWPFYPRMVQAYADVGAKVVACLAGSVKAPKVENGKVVGPMGPDDQWTRNVAHVLLSFPQISKWEMSNEYDLPVENARAEKLVGWKNYQAYHARLGELVHLLLGDKGVAVENGRAGIWPDLVQECVESGAFDKIDVVNSHHYTGVDAPEDNYGNFNTGFEGSDAKAPALFYDDLRAVTRAGRVDGRQRAHWLTEFGWDTLAGRVVTPYQQAVYLQRGYMLAMAAGCEKAFWFFHFDSPDPKQFFDGCGLLTHDSQPKLALSAMAGLTHILPTPKYIGMINAGDNTAGYVFEQDDQYVASLFTIHGDDGPVVSFNASKVCDYLGNEIDKSNVKLTMAPVFAVGISKTDPLFRQTAYSLDTPYMVLAAAGDVVEPRILVENNRGEAFEPTVTMKLPEGWTAGEQSRKNQSADRRVVTFPFTVSSSEKLGMKEVTYEINENGQHVKTITLKVLVQPRLVLSVSPIHGRPGETEITVKVGNRSQKPVSGKVALRLPGSWKTATPEIAVADLKPNEIREVSARLTWSANWGVDESATVAFVPDDGGEVARPIIPNQYVIHRAKGITVDGKLDEWPANSVLPGWMVGANLGEPNATIRVAWAEEGLYVAADVKDSKLLTSDPRSFWAGDVLEVFIDAADDKRQRSYEPGDHQFWFVPQTDAGKVYVGQWKQGSEIPETRYDLQGIKTASHRTADGYIMEFLLPAAQIEKFQPAPGKRIGFNLILTVHGDKYSREVYWPRAKEPGVITQPGTWGSLELVE